MRLIFLASHSLPFSPRIPIEDQPVGGSETALFWVAKGLGRLGWDVTVVNHCGMDSGQHDGVRYLDLARDWTRWRSEARATPPDVLVLFRRMLDVLTDIPSKLRVFWALDHQGVYVSDPPSLGRSVQILWRQATGPLFHNRVDRVVVLSQFMADLFHWLFRTPRDKLAIVPVGIDASLFQAETSTRRPLHFVHTSVPERGLAQLLRDIFPEIRRLHPKAELHVFSYQPLDAYRRYEDRGIHFQGWVTKEELARALQESWLMLYPATFEEMGAISVLESMAAGTPAVTSTLGVLSELAQDGRGVVVPGRPGTKEFAEHFVEATLALLKEPAQIDRMRRTAHEYVLTHHDWQAIARRWHRVLGDLTITAGSQST